MSGSGSVGVVRSAVAALNRGDIEGYTGHFDPSCRRWVAGITQPFTIADASDNLQQLGAVPTLAARRRRGVRRRPSAAGVCPMVLARQTRQRLLRSRRDGSRHRGRTVRGVRASRRTRRHGLDLRRSSRAPSADRNRFDRRSGPMTRALSGTPPRPGRHRGSVPVLPTAPEPSSGMAGTGHRCVRGELVRVRGRGDRTRRGLLVEHGVPALSR